MSSRSGPSAQEEGSRRQGWGGAHAQEEEEESWGAGHVQVQGSWSLDGAGLAGAGEGTVPRRSEPEDGSLYLDFFLSNKMKKKRMFLN